VVGRIQIAFDPNLFPFTNKRSDNPRYKFLDTLLGHGSDAIDGADNAAFDDAVEVDLPDPSSVLALGTWHLTHSVSA
jgi:hypothetical protein